MTEETLLKATTLYDKINECEKVVEYLNDKDYIEQLIIGHTQCDIPKDISTSFGGIAKEFFEDELKRYRKELDEL